MVRVFFTAKKWGVSALVLLVFILSIPPVFSSSGDDTGIDYYATLRKKLIHDKINPVLIEKIYTHDNICFDSDGTALFFKHNEATLHYQDFLSRDSINRAIFYIKKHKKELVSTEKKFGVDKTVLTAIILVETGLGTNTGKRMVINTLSSMAALSDPVVREDFWNDVHEDDPDMTRADFDKKADRKSKWAYKELKAFISYMVREKKDLFAIFAIKGSYAGALGIGQFMPTAVAAYAKDGDKDGRIDMFDHADALASIANYLKKNGWHAGISKKRAKKVLYTYNNSSYYVDTLMKISKELKGKHG